MIIRFLQNVPSENPDYPFVAGQVIETPAPSDYLLSLLDGVRATVVPVDDTERAVEPDLSRSEPERPRGKRHARS